MRTRLTYADVWPQSQSSSPSAGPYAAVVLPANSVGSKQIKRQAVKGSDRGNIAVTSVRVKNGSLLSTDFEPGQLVAGAPGS